VLKFLPGIKSHSEIDGCADFLRSLKGFLAGTDICVFDLEVGGDGEAGRRFGVHLGDEALCPQSAEVLLGGTMGSDIRGYELIFADKDERAVVRRLVDQLEAVYNRNGVIMGHNIVGYDIPMVVARARILGVVVPEWLALSCAKTQRGNFTRSRIVDSLYLYSPFSRFSKQGMSLADTSSFWGRKFDSLGAKFGEMWRGNNSGDRAALQVYNLWNLIDSLSLAAFTGAADFYRSAPGSFSDTQEILLPAWTPDERYVASSLPARGGGVVHRERNVFAWLTAPLSGLYENGPSASKGWGRTVDDEKKIKYPYKAGRQNPQAVQIVGFVGMGPDGAEVVLNVDNEISSISQGLTWIAKRREQKIWVDDLASFQSLAVYRASLYNAVVPDWLVCGGKSNLKDIGSLDEADGHWTVGNLAQAKGIVIDGSSVATPPLYCGQGEANIKDAAVIWGDAVEAFLSACPWP